MNEMSGPERAATSPFPGWPLGQMTLDVAQQFWGRNQTAAKALADLSTEVTEFVSQRLSQGSEVIGRMTQCQSLPEVLEVETQWLSKAFDDYSKEAGRLMEANGKFFGSLLTTTQQDSLKPPPAKQSARATG